MLVRLLGSGDGTRRTGVSGAALVALALHGAVGFGVVWQVGVAASTVASRVSAVVIDAWPDHSMEVHRAPPEDGWMPAVPTVDLPDVGRLAVSPLAPDLRIELGRGELPETRELASGPGSSGPALVVDEPPQLVAGPPVEYPEALRRAGIEGRVLVRAVLDTLGRPEAGSAVLVVRVHRVLDSAALAFVTRATYRPARVNGRAVRVLVAVPVQYRLRTP